MIGMSATIQSQMTQDEVIDFAKRVLELAGVPSSAVTLDDPQRLQSRTHLLATVIGVCGRPIAAAEVAAIQRAQAEFDRVNRPDRPNPIAGALGMARPVPFVREAGALQHHGPDSGQAPAVPASGEWEP